VRLARLDFGCAEECRQKTLDQFLFDDRAGEVGGAEGRGEARVDRGDVYPRRDDKNPMMMERQSRSLELGQLAACDRSDTRGRLDDNVT